MRHISVIALSLTLALAACAPAAPAPMQNAEAAVERGGPSGEGPSCGARIADLRAGYAALNERDVQSAIVAMQDAQRPDADPDEAQQARRAMLRLNRRIQAASRGYDEAQRAGCAFVPPPPLSPLPQPS